MSAHLLRKVLISELTIWIVIAVLGCFYLYPLRQSLRFGTDLVGGVYLTLEVQTEKAIEASLVGKMRSISTYLKRNHLPVPHAKKVENGAIFFEFKNMSDAQEAARVMLREESALKQLVENAQVKLFFSDKDMEQIRDDA